MARIPFQPFNFLLIFQKNESECLQSSKKRERNNGDLAMKPFLILNIQFSSRQSVLVDIWNRLKNRDSFWLKTFSPLKEYFTFIIIFLQWVNAFPRTRFSGYFLKMPQNANNFSKAKSSLILLPFLSFPISRGRKYNTNNDEDII